MSIPYSYTDHIVSSSSSGGNHNQTIHIDSHMGSQLQNFEGNPDQIYSLTTAGMENLHQNTLLWRGLIFNKPDEGVGSASDCGPAAGPAKELNVPTSSEDQFYHHHHQQQQQHDLTGTTNEPLMSWNHHNRSLVHVDWRSCDFPYEGHERPSQGLSLSLNSSDPSSVTLQSFELIRQHPGPPRFAPSGSHLVQGQSYVRNSRYLGPAQDLLNQFCSLGTKQGDDNNTSKIAKVQDENHDANKSSLHSLDLLELQIRKTKLIHMLEEVDSRYKRYRDQMKAVATSFEAVAGNGAAAVYSGMASRAMSRHFRCLRDGIMSQMKATKMAIEDKNTTTSTGAIKGETPRLRLLDQRLRQKRAIQQMNMMETHPWRPQRGLPERSVSVLRAWLFEHFLHPYPSDVDKHILSRQTGLSRSQVSNWFINARVRLWKPMVEEMYTAELKEQNPDENAQNHQDRSNLVDQKPTLDQTVRKDSDTLASVINNNDAKMAKPLEIQHHQNPKLSRVGDPYCAMELDFSSYGGGGSGGGSGGRVSLTLGLHQHNLAFSPSSHSQSPSLFYTREQMEECQTVHHPYSLLESDQSQNLPYRNLMGAQLLRDMGG